MLLSRNAVTPLQMERCATPSTNERNLIKDAIQFVMRAVQLANDIDIYASANSPHAGKRLMRGEAQTTCRSNYSHLQIIR